MEVCAANCGRASKLNCVAATSKSSWTFAEEEDNQKRIGPSDTCQRQERNGKAAHGKVRARRGPVKEAGVVSVSVRGPNETKPVAAAILACLDLEQLA